MSSYGPNIVYIIKKRILSRVLTNWCNYLASIFALLSTCADEARVELELVSKSSLLQLSLTLVVWHHWYIHLLQCYNYINNFEIFVTPIVIKVSHHVQITLCTNNVWFANKINYFAILWLFYCWCCLLYVTTLACQVKVSYYCSYKYCCWTWII